MSITDGEFMCAEISIGTGTVTLRWPVAEFALVTLNRPERLNAINDNLVADLLAALDAAAANPGCRAVVLTGAGRGFCAGADLKDEGSTVPNHDLPASVNYGRQEKWSSVSVRLHEFGVPVIAAVNGPAVGGGLAISAACDLRVAAESAHFAVANVRIGLSGGEMGQSWTLPRLIGHSRATELLLTGRPLGARESAEWGLVSRVVPDGEVVDAALELAHAIGANPAFGVSLTKEMLRVSSEVSSLRQAVVVEDRTQSLAVYARDVDAAAANFRRSGAGKPDRWRFWTRPAKEQA
jgi:enoyl-CoA hydratase